MRLMAEARFAAQSPRRQRIVVLDVDLPALV